MWFQRASERVNNISSCTENSLRSCARCANARVLAADFRVDRKSTLVVTPPCEWVCIGVNGVLLEVACEFGVGSNSLGYGCRGGCLWLQQVSKGFLFSCWWHRCLRQGLCWAAADALAPVPPSSVSNISSISVHFVCEVFPRFTWIFLPQSLQTASLAGSPFSFGWKPKCSQRGEVTFGFGTRATAIVSRSMWGVVRSGHVRWWWWPTMHRGGLRSFAVIHFCGYCDSLSYANRFLQQLYRWLVSDDLGGEDAGCGGHGLVWLHVVCGCEAGWMYCQILWNAFGDSLW